MKMVKKALWGIFLFGMPILLRAQNVVDTASKPVTRVSKPRPYKEVITAKAVTDDGLFKVHKVDERYYFQIPDSLFDRDILIVNRIAKAAAGTRDGMFGYAGDMLGSNVIQFAKGPNNRVFIKDISYSERSEDTTENGLYRSVLNSNLQPIIFSFDIKTFTPDSSSCVIDVSELFEKDNDLLFFETAGKKMLNLGAFQADKSYVESVHSFPFNIEISTLKTYVKTGGGFASYELNSSMVLLPSVPMKPRYYDKRVGYFSTEYKDFDANSQGVKKSAMITRWKLEPRDEDTVKYKRGELVEPRKPIVFYIDPATPKKWVPYLIQGVNDWQKAFEKAGFKNAIYALAAPEGDPEWSLEDARHNAIVYKPSDIPNASGPHVHDPRSGEILETHINWYHNVMSLIHDWYMIQAGAVDPRARKMEFDDSLMGQLIRFVSSHEVGHTLGLMHNFGASSTVPVEKLRDKKWVEQNGFCPSIMDYARFNYVAQPEDSISAKGIFPRIGAYDEWAIEWGYRWLPDLKSKEEEKAFLNNWVINHLEKDNHLWFGSETAYTDPRCQSEDLGDDAMSASLYGIKNLKRVNSQIYDWTKQPNEGYSDLVRIYNQVFQQFRRYLFHVADNIGGTYQTPKTIEQSGPVFEIVPAQKQREAVIFLNQQLFTTPLWIINKKVNEVTGASETYIISLLQDAVLKQVISQTIFGGINRNVSNQPKDIYTVSQLLNDLKNEIWKELKTNKPIDIYRRNLQKLYTERLCQLVRPDEDEQSNLKEMVNRKANEQTDIPSLIRGQIKDLIQEITKSLLYYKVGASKLHLEDVRERLQRVSKQEIK